MITDEEFKSLGYLVKTHTEGARPVEEVQVELLWAILKELRSNREATQQMAKQFNMVSAGCNTLAVEPT